MSLRIGFVGVGGIAQTHLKNVHGSNIASVVAVSDINPEAADAAASAYGATAYTDTVQMLDSEQLDAVFVSVPPFAHGDIEEQIVERNIHLFVEKPLGLDLEEVQRKADVIRNSGVVNATGYCLRYSDIVEDAKRYLEEKSIALVTAYYCTRFVSTPWWRVKAKSGGQLVEQTTHTVDTIRYLCGEIDTLHAFMGLLHSQDIENLDIPDVGTINFHLQSGGIGTLHTTFLQPDHRSGVEIMGKGFRITVDGGRLVIFDGDETIIRQSKADMYQRQDLAFLQAIQTGDRSLIRAPYEEGLMTLAVTLAANRSAESGQVEQILLPTSTRA